MNRIKTGWKLFRLSLGMIWKDKRLMVLPFLSVLLTFFITVSFFIPFYPIIESALEENGESFNPLYLILLYILYVVGYVIIIYFNVALATIVLRQFEGVRLSISDGLRHANSKLGSIFGFALIAATVGVILNGLSNAAQNSENRGTAILGQLAVGLLGTAWNVFIFLVVPVLVLHDIGPIGAIKKSGSMLRKTWGEQLVGTFSAGIILAIAALPFILFGGFLIYTGAESASTALIIVGGIVVAATILIMQVVSSTLTVVLQSVVYTYAVSGAAAGTFDKETLQDLFVSRK